MGIVEELSKYLTIPFDEVLNYKYTVIGGNLVNVTGYKKILQYSSKSVTLSVKDNQLCIEGKNITIKELDKGNIILSGKINRVYLVKENV